MNKKVLIPFFLIIILSTSVFAFSFLEWYKKTNNWLTGRVVSIPQSNLVAHYTFDDGSAADSSGMENDGIINGATVFETSRGKAIYFDGTDDYVEVPDDPTLRITDAVTLIAWIYPRSCTFPGQTWSGIIAKGDTSVETRRSYSFYTDNRIKPCGLHFSTSTSSSATNSGSISTKGFDLERWSHVAVVVQTSPAGGTITYYINGEPAGTTSNPSLTSLPGDLDTSNLFLGRIWEPKRFFNGLVDEVKIYKRALTQEEIIKDGCKKPGEVWRTSPENRNNFCCPGSDFTSVAGVAEENEDICWMDQEHVMCSECGNGNCESWENKCNCPGDCEEIKECTDSDGGLNYYVKGTTEKGDYKNLDYCQPYSKRLTEFYCEDDAVKSVGFHCPSFACQDGECVNLTGEYECSDTEAGTNQYKKGTCTTEGAQGIFEMSDTCTSPIILQEIFCGNNGFIEPSYFRCERGCKDGACIQEITLTDYPKPFIEDYKLNGFIVVGDSASSSDTLSATEILTSLNGLLPGPLPADSWKVGTTFKKLEMSEKLDSTASPVIENINNITRSISEDELNALADGSVANDKGTAVYSQYMHWENKWSGGTVAELSGSEYVMFLENDDNVMGDFFYVGNKEQIARYELEFKLPFKSDIYYNTMGEYEGRRINLTGFDYEIVSARKIDANGIRLNLMKGILQATMEEGERRTFTINGKDYLVTVTGITDTGTIVVKFDVNGEATHSLRQGNIYQLSDGLVIGVSDILPGEAGDPTGDSVTFYFGAETVVFQDNDVTDTSSTNKLEVDGTVLDNADVTIMGGIDSDVFKIDVISINITADDDYYVPAGGKLTKLMGKPQALINWDIQYRGLSGIPTEDIKIKTSSAEQYELEFVDGDGNSATIPIAWTSGSNNLKFGDDDDNLIIKESQTITRNDYLIVTDESSMEPGRRNTYALRYKGADKSNDENPFIRFLNLGDGQIIEESYTLINNQAKATINLGGANFSVYSASDTSEDNFDIQVDLNGDGTLESNTVRIATNYGAEIEIGEATGANHISVNIRVVNANDYETLAPSELSLNISARGGKLRMAENGTYALKAPESDKYTQYGYTSLGAEIVLTNPTNAPQELAIKYPQRQRLPQLFVTSGESSPNISTLKLASEIEEATAQNLISVGNACNNALTATIMNLPTTEPDCFGTLQEGYGLIKLYRHSNGKVAIVVAGYNNMDSRRAARVLANYQNYNLSGTEICVSGTSLDDIYLEKCSPELCPDVRCTDSDNGINYYVSGSTTGNFGEDCNITKPDHCIDNEEVTEFYCDGSSMKQISYRCPNGCQDGACIQENCVAEGETTPIVPNALSCCDDLKKISVASAAYDSEGNLLCGIFEGVSLCSNCGNKVCESRWENICNCPADCSKQQTCTDSDGGKNFFVKGTTTGRASTMNNATITRRDMCSLAQKNGLVEYFCGEDNVVQAYLTTCENGCEDGACTNESEPVCDNGCSYMQRCLPVGIRVGTLYCSTNGIMEAQAGDDEICNNGYECKTNMCIRNSCVTTTVWLRFLRWIGLLS